MASIVEMSTDPKCLPRVRRLNSSKDFRQVFQGTYKHRAKDFALFAKQNGLSFARLGINIAKKNVPLAVTRNAIKRIIRESFRTQQSVFIGVDIVVVVYKAALSDSERKVFNDNLAKQWRKLAIRLLSKPSILP